MEPEALGAVALPSLGTRRALALVADPNSKPTSEGKQDAPQSASAEAETALAAARKALALPTIGTLHFLDGHSVELLDRIGEGGFGTVYSARSSRHSLCACKMVGHGGDLGEIADIAREVACHKRLSGLGGSTSVVQLLDHYTEPVRSILLLELCSGVELEAHILEQPHGRLSECAARPIAALLLEAVAHCHDAGVCHQDIQPRNLLVEPERGRLKLIDYGGANFFGPNAAAPKRAAGDSEADVGEAMKGYVRERGGADNYRAPERHMGDDDEEDEVVFFHGPAADSWSVGCTLFYMLTGRDAFDWEEEGDEHRDELYDDIEAGKIPFGLRVGTAPAQELSHSVRSLISALLTYEPLERPGPRQAAAHEWFTAGAAEETVAVEETVELMAASVVAAAVAAAVASASDSREPMAAEPEDVDELAEQLGALQW